MKRVICILMMLALAAGVQSQTKHLPNTPLKPNGSKAKPGADSVFNLRSEGTYPAKFALHSYAAQPFRVYPGPESVLPLSNIDIRFSEPDILGMPKHAYGFANGHLSLKSTGATTSGTQTGSGSVGTGTSLGTFGSSGPAMGVNGKSPYAGNVMWGNAVNMYVPVTDSLARGFKRQSP